MKAYPLIEVSGDEWKAFFVETGNAMNDPWSNPAWKARIDDWMLKYRSGGVKALWFEPWEEPVASIAQKVNQTPAQRAYLSFQSGDTQGYLEVSYHSFGKDNWLPFIGFSGREPPVKHLYPLRPYWFIPVIACLLFYIFLPRANVSKTAALYIRRWRLTLADVVSMLIFCSFFLLPFVLGGPIQAFSRWWGIAMVCWPIGMLGLFILGVTSWYAGVILVPDNKGIVLRSWSHTETIGYDNIAHVDPVILKPPRWLKILMMIAAVMGKGSSSVLAAGQAAILEGSAHGGLSFHLKDGRSFDFWLTDQMGGLTFVNSDLLVQALKRADVSIGAKPAERGGLGLGMSLLGSGKWVGVCVVITFLATPLLITALCAAMSV